MITVQYYGELYHLTGARFDTLEADSVQDVLVFMQKRYGENVFACARHSLVYRNRTLVFDLNRVYLRDGDLLSFFPPAAGG